MKSKIKYMNSGRFNSDSVNSSHVVHFKQQPFDVYIGRPSKWGNPFSHKHGTLAKYKVASREEAVEAYRKWITTGDGRYLLKELHELKGKRLGCWCKPQSCHGDVLAELVAQFSHQRA